jgi:hypothetical protein
VAAVVLTWNSYEDTAACLASLGEQSYPALDVLLIDNGSTDGSVDRLTDEFPGVDLVRTGENRGSAGGYNAGVETALDRDADLVWLLNNDVIAPEPDLVTRLVDRMAAHEDVGILSPEVREYPDTDRVWFRQGDVDWQDGSIRHEREVYDESRTEGDLVYDGYIPFCSALVRAELFSELGLLDESYFIYLEDADFCTRTAAAGYRLATDTGAFIHHRESATTGGPLTPFFLYYMPRNRWLFYRRFDGRIPLGGFLGSLATWLGKNAALSLAKRRVENIGAATRGVVDGVRGVGGKGPYP